MSLWREKNVEKRNGGKKWEKRDRNAKYNKNDNNNNNNNNNNKARERIVKFAAKLL